MCITALRLFRNCLVLHNQTRTIGTHRTLAQPGWRGLGGRPQTLAPFLKVGEPGAPGRGRWSAQRGSGWPMPVRGEQRAAAGSRAGKQVLTDGAGPQGSHSVCR